MAAPREIHIRATATGAWVVQLDESDAALSWHTNETEAELTASAVAATYGGAPAIVIHDRYERLHEASLSGRRWAHVDDEGRVARIGTLSARR